MTIGTSSASSGSTLTWLIDLILTAEVPRYGPRFLYMPKYPAWGSINESLATGDTHTYQREPSSFNVKAAPLPPVLFVHVMVQLMSSFPFRFLCYLCGPLFPSHDRLHLMCVHPPRFPWHSPSILSSTPHPARDRTLYFLVMSPVIVCSRPPSPQIGVVSCCNTLVAWS